MHLIIFIVFAGCCLAGAINLLLQTHPINSALSLIVVMTSLAVLYLLLGAEFLAAAQIIVYSGAIMVLFTFVVMLLNAGREERTLGSRAAKVVGFPAVVAILAVLATIASTAIYEHHEATKAAAILEQQQRDAEQRNKEDEAFRKKVEEDKKKHNSAAAHEGKTWQKYVP